jgi:hypothetical protein
MSIANLPSPQGTPNEHLSMEKWAALGQKFEKDPANIDIKFAPCFFMRELVQRRSTRKKQTKSKTAALISTVTKKGLVSEVEDEDEDQEDESEDADVPLEKPAQFKCRECKRMFKSKGGRSSHVRQTHRQHVSKVKTPEPQTPPRIIKKRERSEANKSKSPSKSQRSPAKETERSQEKETSTGVSVGMEKCNFCSAHFPKTAVDELRTHVKAHLNSPQRKTDPTKFVQADKKSAPPDFMSKLSASTTCVDSPTPRLTSSGGAATSPEQLRNQIVLLQAFHLQNQQRAEHALQNSLVSRAGSEF